MDDESDGEDAGVPLRNTRMEHALDEEQLGSVDEGRPLISEAKEAEDRNEDGRGVSSKHVRFADMGSDSDTTPHLMMLGLNASAQQSQSNLHVAGTRDAVPHLVGTTEDDGVGVSVGSPGDHVTDRSIEDKAGIILVSQYFPYTLGYG